jgi:predicted nucleic acid-binding protein
VVLLVRRKRVHLVAKFLDYLDRSAALLLINPDDTLLRSAKAMIRRQADQGYSFVDCLSFCLMSEESRRGIDHRCAFPEGRFHSLAAVNRLSQWIINF